MKKIIISVLIISASFLSCSDDSSTNNAQDTSLDLLKTVKYIPTKEAYDNDVEGSKKNVQYFEGHKVVADTTFDASGGVASMVIHNYTSNSHTVEYIDTGVSFRKFIYTYDNQGRISEIRPFSYMGGSTLNPGVYSQLVYNSGSITENKYDPDTDAFMPQYTISLTVNPIGLIDGWVDSSNGMVYENNKPVQMNDSTTANLEYYDVPMPTNMVKTAIEFNNLFFESDDYRISMSEMNNFYLKRYIFPELPVEMQFVTFEKTFNDLGYITYSKAIGVAYENQRDSETFYYYQ